jgi:hypothetical protein
MDGAVLSTVENTDGDTCQNLPANETNSEDGSSNLDSTLEHDTFLIYVKL